MQKSLSSIFLLCTSFLFAIAVLTGCSSGDKKIAGAGKDLPVYLGDNFSSHYSKLTQISKDNIDQLELARTYHTGDDAASGDQYVAFTLKSSK